MFVSWGQKWLRSYLKAAWYKRPVAQSSPRVTAKVPRGAYSDPQRPPLPHDTHYQVLERKLAAIASRLPVPRQIVLYVGNLSLKHGESLPNMAMRREMVGGEKTTGQSAKRLQYTIYLWAPPYLPKKRNIMDAVCARLSRVVPGRKERA